MTEPKIFKKYNKDTTHAVKKMNYGDGDQYQLMTPYVKTWCNKTFELTDMDRYNKYDKETHKEVLCLECKRGISSYYRAKQRQANS